MLDTRNNHHTISLRSLSSWMESYSRRQHFRRMAQSLLTEKDDILADLGYERHELINALDLPFWSDASRYLETHRSKRQH